MKLIITLFLLFPLISNAQSDSTTAPVDSVRYYRNEMGKFVQKTRTAAYQSEEFQTLERNYLRAIQRRKKYTGFVLLLEFAHVDNREFNDSLSQHSFSKLNPIQTRIGLGLYIRRNRLVFDFNAAVAGIPNQSKKNGEEIESSFNNFLQFDFGFDLLGKEDFGIYPFGGLSLRSSVLRYKKDGQPNPNYGFITDMVTDGERLELESFRLGYQYGIGFEYSGWGKSKTGKTIICIKVGTNQPFNKDTYEYDGVPNYDPELKQGDWVIGLSFKFCVVH